MRSYESEGGGKHLSFGIVQRMSSTPSIKGSVNLILQALSPLSCARGPKRKIPKSSFRWEGKVLW